MGIRLDPRDGANSTRDGQRILGIDPGTVNTGWGVVEMAGEKLRHLAHGTLSASAGSGQGERLRRIYRGLGKIIRDYEPEGISLEKVFFARNAQSALKLGQARGVVLLAAAEGGLAVHEYASAEIKLAVVGYGRASKEQVQSMVASLLGVPGRIPADAADALAAAICHLHQTSFRARVVGALPGAGERIGAAAGRNRRGLAAGRDEMPP